MSNKIKQKRSNEKFDEIKIDEFLAIEPFDTNYKPPILKAHEFLELLDKAEEYFSYISAEAKKDINLDELIFDDDGLIVGSKNQSEYLSKIKPLKDCEDYLKKNPFDVFDLIHVMQIYNDLNISNKAKLAALSKLKNDPKQKALAEIKNHYQANKCQFKRRGYSAQFIREMHDKYPIIESQKTIENLVSALNKQNEDIPR